MEAPEKDAIISGIGISRIGRRLEASGLELTVEAGLAAIADAGLEAADIDGLSTMGDTPVHEAAHALGVSPAYQGGGFGTGGLLSPAMSAFLAVATGRARHVLVYRTVQMMGGTILPAGGAPAQVSDAPPLPPPTARGSRTREAAGSPT